MGDEYKGFKVGARLRGLVGSYPRAEDVLRVAEVGESERAALARLWVSEGIPFAFKKVPALYEETRRWLATGIDVDPKQISLGGSGRLGYSLDPGRWGERYDSKSSDLDYYAVSDQLFDRLRRDFELWSKEYREGVVQPFRGEPAYWEWNLRGTPKNIAKGFLNSNRVPNRQNYKQFRKVNDCLATLRSRLTQFDGGPAPQKKLTLRCYRDWRSYERQMSLNLRTAVQRNR